MVHFRDVFLCLDCEWILRLVTFMGHKCCCVSGVLGLDVCKLWILMIGMLGGFDDWRCVIKDWWLSEGLVLSISWQNLEHEWAWSLAVSYRWAWILWIWSYRLVVKQIVSDGLWWFYWSDLQNFDYLRAFLIRLLLDDLAGISNIKWGFRVVAVTILVAHCLFPLLTAFFLLLLHSLSLL